MSTVALRRGYNSALREIRRWKVFAAGLEAARERAVRARRRDQIKLRAQRDAALGDCYR